YTQDEFLNSAFYYSGAKDSNGESLYDKTLDKNRFSYDEILGMIPKKTFYYYPNDTIYAKNENDVMKMNPFTYRYQSDDSFKNGMELKIVGILKPKENISYGCMTSGFFYTEAFTKKFLDDNMNSEIVKELKASGKESYTSTTYNSIPTGISYQFTYQSIEKDSSGKYLQKENIGFVGTENTMMNLLGTMMGGTATEPIYTLALRELGGIDVANSIKIYPVNFELKDGVTSHLDKWNSSETISFTRPNGTTVELKATERFKVTYTDNIAVIINLINSLINMVTTALISFTALALVVSCFMIAIITYVSVVERVKEIGVIRSLGGRKKDVTHLFNAETFIIGLASGIFGIIVTYFISMVLNVIVKKAAGVYPIAALPWWQALIMIGVSILLTVVSGLIPARSAAKKDPVVALRTE
ncbi:MAG: ABC transporter permease, partial [Anaeroplasmataceae bacterium]|nr:ABC transporter permease [Anaeroplasmataceae bacterium]